MRRSNSAERPLLNNEQNIAQGQNVNRHNRNNRRNRRGNNRRPPPPVGVRNNPNRVDLQPRNAVERPGNNRLLPHNPNSPSFIPPTIHIERAGGKDIIIAHPKAKNYKVTCLYGTYFFAFFFRLISYVPVAVSLFLLSPYSGGVVTYFIFLQL